MTNVVSAYRLCTKTPGAEQPVRVTRPRITVNGDDRWQPPFWGGYQPDRSSI